MIEQRLHRRAGTSAAAGPQRRPNQASCRLEADGFNDLRWEIQAVGPFWKRIAVGRGKIALGVGCSLARSNWTELDWKRLDRLPAPVLAGLAVCQWLPGVFEVRGPRWWSRHETRPSGQGPASKCRVGLHQRLSAPASPLVYRQ